MAVISRWCDSATKDLRISRRFSDLAALFELKSDGKVLQRLFKLLEGYTVKGRPLTSSVGSLEGFRLSLPRKRTAGTTAVARLRMGSFGGLVNSQQK